MESDDRESQPKKFKSTQRLSFELPCPALERGEADQKKLKISPRESQELIEEVYVAKTERGEADLKKAKIAQEPPVEWLLKEAHDRFKDNKPAQAIQLFEEAFFICKNTTDLYAVNFMLGFLYGFRMPRSDRHAASSCNYFSNALEILRVIEPHNDSGTCNNQKGTIFRLLALLHFQQGDNEQAEMCAENALIDEQEPLMRVRMYHILGISLRPKNQEASCRHLEKGMHVILDMVKDRDTDARKEWAIKADENKSSFYGKLLTELANTQFINKSLDDAQTNYEKALTFQPSLADKGTIWVQLGLIYHKKGKISRANNQGEHAQDFAQSSRFCFDKASQNEIKQCNVAAYNLAIAWLKSHPQ